MLISSSEQWRGHAEATTGRDAGCGDDNSDGEEKMVPLA